MAAHPKRIRYTHKDYIHRTTNEIFSGPISSNMTIVGFPPQNFQVMLFADKACRIRLAGSLNHVDVIERASFNEKGVIYTSNAFDTLTSIRSDYWETGATITITAVDSVGMPISWTQTYGPFRCEFDRWVVCPRR